MHVLIVEDEQTIARRLERLLQAEAADEIVQIDRCLTLQQAQEIVSQQTIDVVFLDLNLNGKDGFTLVTDLTSKSFHVVVVSAHTERAMEAFEIGVLDFIGKPFGAERIRKTLDRLRGARANHPAAKLSVRVAGRVQMVPVSDVAYVQAAGAYSELVMDNGTVFVHNKSLEQLLMILPASFERIHRSYLVRVSDITQIRTREGSRYAAVLQSGKEIPVGRTRIEVVRSRLGIS